MQVKQVLAGQLGAVITDVSAECKKIRLWIKLPPSMSDGEMSPRTGKYIPRSHIAQKFENNLLTLHIPKSTKTNLSPSTISTTDVELILKDEIPSKTAMKNSHSHSNYNYNYNHNRDRDHEEKDCKNSKDNGSNINTNVSKLTSGFNLDENFCVLGSEPSRLIIDPFRQLYHKYIDANGAVFEVNISSSKRDKIMRLFDVPYYNSMQNTGESGNNGAMGFITNLTRSFSSGKNMKDVDSHKILKSFINDELDGYVRNLDSKSIITQKTVLKWLLIKIMTQFESSIMEIAFLMNDSFGRFQRTEQDIFEKLCKLSQV